LRRIFEKSFFFFFFVLAALRKFYRLIGARKTFPAKKI